jgi:hypothetical protein
MNTLGNDAELRIFTGEDLPDESLASGITTA